MFFFLRYKAGIESPHVLEVKMKFATQLRIVLLAFFLCLGNLSQTKCLITRKIHFVHVWDEAALVQCVTGGGKILNKNFQSQNLLNMSAIFLNTQISLSVSKTINRCLTFLFYPCFQFLQSRIIWICPSLLGDSLGCTNVHEHMYVNRVIELQNTLYYWTGVSGVQFYFNLTQWWKSVTLFEPDQSRKRVCKSRRLERKRVP